MSQTTGASAGGAAAPSPPDSVPVPCPDPPQPSTPPGGAPAHRNDDDDMPSSAAAAEERERPSIYAPYHQYMLAMQQRVRKLRVKDKRAIFHAMREQGEVTAESFLPRHGIAVHDFTAFQILNGRPRQSRGGGGGVGSSASAAVGSSSVGGCGAGTNGNKRSMPGQASAPRACKIGRTLV